MYHNSCEKYQFDKETKIYYNKNGRIGKQLNSCLFFRYQMVRK